MTVALFTHPECLGHDTGAWHPECPDRLRAVWRALEHTDFAPLQRQEAPAASAAQLARAHPAEYVDAILAVRPAAGESVALDGDTQMSAGSAQAAQRAAGGAVAGVDAVLDGWAQAAFAAVRPPGHHAEPTQPMGFCLFNNVAVAAHQARARGLQRIAVVDFDVHHGNGTQAMFQHDAELFYASSHQSPLFPGTGRPDEHGVAGNIANATLPPGSGADAFRAAWIDRLLPALDAFAPELLIISAGFDAHRADPLAQLCLEVGDFTWLTAQLLAIADARCGGRVVSVLEGGYDLDALAACTAAHVRGLMRIAG